MRPTLTLFRREFTAYFLSPIAYVLLTVFLALTGLLFTFTMRLLTEDGSDGVEWPMQSLLGNAFFARLGVQAKMGGEVDLAALLGSTIFWLLFLPIPALLTMRSFAEERGTGTLEVLLTAPLRDWQVVFAKYAAAFLFYVMLWLPTLAYIPVLLNMEGWHARIDARPMYTTYAGLALVGAMFLSVGMFISSLVRSQLIAAQFSLVAGLIFIAPTLVRPFLNSNNILYRVVTFISVPLHFSNDFTRGLIDSRHVVLYASVTLFFLFMTVRSLEGRRWS